MIMKSLYWTDIHDHVCLFKILRLLGFYHVSLFWSLFSLLSNEYGCIFTFCLHISAPKCNNTLRALHPHRNRFFCVQSLRPLIQPLVVRVLVHLTKQQNTAESFSHPASWVIGPSSSLPHPSTPMRGLHSIRKTNTHPHIQNRCIQ
jgi:hypothetical protein